MAAIGFSGLNRSFVVATLLCGVASGCTSVEYTSQAALTAEQTVVPLSKPDATMVAYAASASSGTVATAAGQIGGPAATIAAVPIAETPSTSAATALVSSAQPNAAIAAAMPMPTEVTSTQVAANGYAPIPLTPEMTAIQSVIPTPRPGSAPAAPSTQLAFAGSPQSASIAALSAIDTTPHAMDFGFDTSGPTLIPAVLSVERDDGAPTAEKSMVSKLISKYSKLYEVPESLLHRIVRRESMYNSKAYNKRGYFGLMQIKYNTAKSMGYSGPAAGLFDAETNIKYAAKYLRGAWVVADSKEDDAVALYARGYYYDAKRKGLNDIAHGNY